MSAPAFGAMKINRKDLPQGESLCERGNDPVCVEGARTMARAAGGR